jgi:molybdopterin-guanine dinucleotide biosynthesis protein A
VSAGCTGVILAGGAASRFHGAAKGLERVGGTRIIDRVANALREATDNLLLIANDPRASTWLPGVPVAADRLVGQGGLGGIHAALVAAAGPVLIVAWDMPFVPGSLLRALREAGAAADAAVAESGSKRGLEPLCAYYTPACVAPIEKRLASGDRRVIGFHEDVRLVRLPHDEVARHGDPERIFMNVNTPDELEIAERHATTTDGRHRRQEA